MNTFDQKMQTLTNERNVCVHVHQGVPVLTKNNGEIHVHVCVQYISMTTISGEFAASPIHTNFNKVE